MNHLAKEPSLYLRQHAENPVDWFPWGSEAFDVAREKNKPVLISIGYSACHWCHVMAHESFENDYIARLMNEHFVCIKVDREERPDVDQIYMESVQMMSGRGGWPLNVFCLPDGRPFAGGTYFPPEDNSRGIIPWPQLLMRISDYFQRNREELEQNAEAITHNLANNNRPLDSGGQELEPHLLVEAARAGCRSHDDEHGGFGDAPKFPPSMTLDFLLGIRASRAVDQNDPELARRIDQVVNTTLTGMAHGGLYDQIGGGFARYSVDKIWLIPHFEKMLYDNGLLLDAYVKGYRRYGKPLYGAIVEETIDWLNREMRTPGQGFAAAIDADSEGEEGRYYVWTPEQVKAVLGEEDGSAFCEAYCITDAGNFEDGFSNPALGEPDFEKRQALRPIREKLLAAREERVPPAKDPKQLVAWNSLVVRGLAQAAFAFGRRDWMTLARETADWLWSNFVTDGRVKSVYYPERGVLNNGTLDDTAFLAQAQLELASVIDWLEPGLSYTYAERAGTLFQTLVDHFADPAGEPGFFFTSDDHESLVHRKKEWYDNAIPAGNSALLHVASGLFALSGDAAVRHPVDALRGAYPGILHRAPTAIAHALSAYVGDALGVAVIKAKDVGDLEPLRAALVERPWRPTYVLVTNMPEQPDGYQLCVGTQCLEPTLDPEEVAARLG